MPGLLGPGALARLDDALLERIRRGDRLGAVIACSIAAILSGAGAYGVAFGIWRAPEQAAFSAIKLPLLFLAVAVCTIALSSMLAMLLRAGLSLAQTTVCILLSFAVTSALLGAMAPIAVLLDLTVPRPDPIALRLAVDDPRAMPSMRVARARCSSSTCSSSRARARREWRRCARCCCGSATTSVTRRVLVAWIGAQLLVGSQLSWLLRPFFGRPHLPPTFTGDDALEGGFFEEVSVLATTTFGPLAPMVGVLVSAGLAMALAWTLRGRAASVTVRREDVGLVVLGALERVVPWSSIASARRRGTEVVIELVADLTLAREALNVRCRDESDAQELVRVVSAQRTRVRAGPFRTASI